MEQINKLLRQSFYGLMGAFNIFGFLYNLCIMYCIFRNIILRRTTKGMKKKKGEEPLSQLTFLGISVLSRISPVSNHPLMSCCGSVWVPGKFGFPLNTRFRCSRRVGRPGREILLGCGQQPEWEQQLRAAPGRCLPYFPRPTDIWSPVAWDPIWNVHPVPLVLVHRSGTGQQAEKAALGDASFLGVSGGWVFFSRYLFSYLRFSPNILENFFLSTALRVIFLFLLMSQKIQSYWYLQRGKLDTSCWMSGRIQ